MKFTTKGEPPTELTCLICGKNEFDMTIQRNIEIPFPNSGPRTVRVRYDYNRYTCKDCGYIMNFDMKKYLEHRK